MKCKNCGHAIKSTNIHMNSRLRNNPNKPWIHVRHDADGNCQVIWCKCCKAEPEENK